MTIWCYGSVNIDHFYTLDHLPAPGETIAARAYRLELGGKGANQSVAAARAGAQVRHLGAVGPDGAEALARMVAAGVDCTHVQRLDDMATGHAVICVDGAGENTIVLHGGANRALALPPVLDALRAVEPGDILLMQNETAHLAEVAEHATGLGMEVIYSAAPFDLDAVRRVLPFVTMLVVNAVEAAQLTEAMGCEIEALPVEAVVITRGAEGAEWRAGGSPVLHQPAFAAEVVDTTGAGDCFTGALAARLAEGAEPADALRFAAAAGALQVGRAGTAGAMPLRAEIDALIGESG